MSDRTPSGRHGTSVLRRRTTGICAVTTVAVVLTLAAPLVLVIAALVDLLRFRWRLPIVRLLAFGWCWSWLELAGVIGAAWLWATGRAGDRRSNQHLQAWWADRLMGALALTCGLRPRIVGARELSPGPTVLLVRHASLADSLLTAWAIIHGASMAPRVVMKRELLVDPCLDIVGNRLPNCFVDRGAADSSTELAAIAAMVADLGSEDVAVIFPEGTRANAEKRTRALGRIAETDPARAERLSPLSHLLPPRVAGTAAMLAAAPTADVVVAWHVGFEGLDTFGGILDALGGPRRDVSIEFRRVPRSQVPSGDGLEYWLDGQWLALDSMVATATDSRGAGDRDDRT